MPKYRTSKIQRSTRTAERRGPLKQEAAQSAKILEGFVEASKLFDTPEREELRRYRNDLDQLSARQRRNSDDGATQR